MTRPFVVPLGVFVVQSIKRLSLPEFKQKQQEKSTSL